MPPRRGRWSLPRTKGSQGRFAVPRGKLPDFILAAPNADRRLNGFSMRDEAKNTASHQASSGWTFEDAKLRQKPVTFVSAGFIEPFKEGLVSKDSSRLDLPGKSSVDVSEDVRGTNQLLDAASLDAAEDIAARPIEEDTAVNNVGRIRTELATISAGSVDQPSMSKGGETKELFFFDLEEDEPTIVPSITPPKIASPRSSCVESDSSEEIILFRGRAAHSGTSLLKNENLPSATPALPEKHNGCNPVANLKHFEEGNAQNSRSLGRVFEKRSEIRQKRSRTLKRLKRAEEEDAILADYIANMATSSDDDPLTHQFQSSILYRDLGNEDDAIDFGVTDEKSPKDDNALDEIEEESAESDANDTGTIGSVKSDDDQDMDASVKGEEFGSISAEQDELGKGDVDLLFLDSFFANTGARRLKEEPVLKAGSSRAPREPPSAAQVADAFDCLDLADWDHLTGRTRRQRSKHPPNFNVSDPDIEAALNAAWKQDRERKKKRKQERETLRSQGLLGKETSPNDLRVKYPSGMKLEDIKLELTSFLVGTAERLEFPPLDKHARKVLHELASKCDIKSQSTGKGDQRRPVLYRTIRTAWYASNGFEEAARHVDRMASRIHRKYFHRVDVKVPKGGSTRNKDGDRSGHRALSFREGEIVGASVPELGRENKGRAMLEKMGWSKGKGLGASDNQGILEPVAQVIKRSKAGLG
ncbi:hypothetical protein VTH06DRAFT_5718 [Thermothelomyces fergusii]